MMQIYRNRKDAEPALIETVDSPGPGTWIRLTSPTEAELAQVAGNYSLPLEFLRAALDEEERPRIDTEDDIVLIVMDIPIVTETEGIRMLSTLPLGIIITSTFIVTVCSRQSQILDDFLAGKVRHFTTAKRTRFLFQIFYRNASYYLNHLRQIEKSISRIEVELHRSMKNEILFQMMELEKSLIYFSTSLKSNEAVLERILRTKPKSLQMFEEDAGLLEDVIIENKQAMEMSQIYLHILNGMTGAFATIISNNLNIVMKFLASITIIIAIPTMIASFYGMNVTDIPLSQTPFSFEIIFGISFVTSVVLGLFMWQKKFF
ncbi:MAG: Cobalt/magnesium transport protein CorA [Methanoregula sp. SKADARSKE-2]|nr:MAG: Cobalt/magnesium transport protein CorA [Methanoregula sp. SKADARSKE-2]